MEVGTFAVPLKQAPFCQCRKMQFLQLSGTIPEGLNRRLLSSFKPSEETCFNAHTICGCGKIHRFTVHANSINSMIKEEGAEL